MAKGMRSMSDLLSRQRKFATQEAIEEVEELADDALKYHRKVVREWAHKPGFRQQKYRNPNVYTIKIVPTGRYATIWYYVDRGTKPHEIAAKNVPFLKFQLGYNARTAPKAQFAQGTGTASGAWVTAKQVHHPGTKARKFSETILKELSPPIEDRIQAAVKRGLDKGK